MQVWLGEWHPSEHGEYAQQRSKVARPPRVQLLFGFDDQPSTQLVDETIDSREANEFVRVAARSEYDGLPFRLDLFQESFDESGLADTGSATDPKGYGPTCSSLVQRTLHLRKWLGAPDEERRSNGRPHSR